jgi:hypothetical protein
MHYFRVTWIEDGVVKLSDPIDKWTDAEIYRRAVGGEILSY